MKKERTTKSKSFGKRQKTEPTKGIDKGLVKEASEVSTTEQVFIYAPPNIWDNIIRYYGENFINLEVYGSSLVTTIDEDYMQNAQVRNIIAFAGSTLELQRIAEFASRLSKLKISSKVVSIAIVLLNNTPHDVLNALNRGNMSLSVMAVNSITNEVLNNIIAHVIENMKPYIIDTEVKPVTEKAKPKSMDLSNTSISDIKSELERVKSSPLTKSRDIYATVEKIVNESKDVIEMDRNLNEVPHMQYLDEISSEISSDLEKLLIKGDKASKERITEMVKLKLYVTGLKAKETETILNEIIARAEIRAGIESEDYRKSMIEYGEIGKASTDSEIETLISQRELGKKEVSVKIRAYASTVRKVQAPATLLAFREDGLHDELRKTLVNSSGLLTHEMEDLIRGTMERYKTVRNEAMAKKKEYEDTLREAVNKGSEIIKDLTDIIALDDIIIDKLVGMQGSKSSRPIMVADSKFEELSSLVVRVPDTGLGSFYKHIRDPRNLLTIYFQGGNPSRKITEGSIDYKAFLREDWTIEGNKIVVPEGSVDLNVITNVLDKTKVLASKFSRIIVMVDIDQSQKVKTFLLSEIPISTVWTDGQLQNVNTVANLLATIRSTKSIARNVIINKADFTENGKTKYETLLASIENRVKIIQVPEISCSEIDRPTHELSNEVLSVISSALSKC